MIFKHILTGFQLTLKNKRVWLLLFSVQLLFASILTVSMKTQFSSLLSDNLMGQEVMAGHTGIAFVEMIVHQGQALAMQMKFVLLMALFYLGVTVFLNGGVFALFLGDAPFQQKTFWGNAGQYFGRFFRLMLNSLLYLIIAVLLYLGVDALLMLFKGDSEKMLVLLKGVGFAFLAFELILVQMTFDYAKMIAIKSDKKSMFKVSLSAWGFVFRRLGRTLSLYLLMLLLGLAVFVVFTGIGGLIPTISGLMVFLLLLWQQLHSFVRAGTRMVFIASQCQLYCSA